MAKARSATLNRRSFIATAAALGAAGLAVPALGQTALDAGTVQEETANTNMRRNISSFRALN